MVLIYSSASKVAKEDATTMILYGRYSVYNVEWSPVVHLPMIQYFPFLRWNWYLNRRVTANAPCHMNILYGLIRAEGELCTGTGPHVQVDPSGTAR